MVILPFFGEKIEKGKPAKAVFSYARVCIVMQKELSYHEIEKTKENMGLKTLQVAKL